MDPAELQGGVRNGPNGQERWQQAESSSLFALNSWDPESWPSVEVTSKTWARDSHDLFDFEAQQLHSETFVVQRSMKCIRSGTQVSMVSESQPTVSQQGTHALLRLVNKENHFFVDKAAPSSNSKKLWLVVRDLHNQAHRLNESDTIKLGRFKFRVRQMVASSSSGVQPELRLDDGEKSMCVANPPVQEGQDLSRVSCRICLLEGPTEDDPLLSPCRCKGSIQYVHLGCLRHWIKGRLNLSDAQASCYYFRPLACELCKAIYPSYVQNGNERSPLVEVPHTQAPFIVLENMVAQSQLNRHGLHVISLAEKELKLGRGHESDVRIADVSISRCHAIIRFDRGQFLLQDNNSKFGTLVALKRPKQLEYNSPISIQMGRTVLSFKLVTRQAGADGGHWNSNAPPMLSDCSRPEDERALRLSLMTRDVQQAPQPPAQPRPHPADAHSSGEDDENLQIPPPSTTQAFL
eukprot:TRINITY_DN20120_c0_g1_i1.p1 TRINITY_DN20120_c0_g1~~TRINITY_DN20120_c0_g1_i1.p1  ORF type:complete len:463 (+),score=90.58 TRINITY_DN20120_c0_g1_i1:102-1490(+)